MAFTKIQNITGGNPQNPGPGNTATGESGIAFDTTEDAIVVFDGTTLTEHVTTVGTQTLTNKTLTAPVITGQVREVETVAATNVITAAESGKVFFLNHATEFVSTLPAMAAGLEYTFICANAPESADFTITTPGAGGGCEVIVGHVLTSGFADSGSDVETTAGGTTITFVQSVAVLGDRVHVICDGTLWYASCICAAEGGITITG
jgi:hypothetical protein